MSMTKEQLEEFLSCVAGELKNFREERDTGLNKLGETITADFDDVVEKVKSTVGPLISAHGNRILMTTEDHDQKKLANKIDAGYIDIRNTIHELHLKHNKKVDKLVATLSGLCNDKIRSLNSKLDKLFINADEKNHLLDCTKYSFYQIYRPAYISSYKFEDVTNLENPCNWKNVIDKLMKKK